MIRSTTKSHSLAQVTGRWSKNIVCAAVVVFILTYKRDLWDTYSGSPPLHTHSHEDPSHFHLHATIPKSELRPDASICTTTTVPEGTNYITGLSPSGRLDLVLRAEVFLCKSKPREPRRTVLWQCKEPLLEKEVCEAGTLRSLHAWEKSLGDYHPPGGAGFEIGEKVERNLVITQVHVAASSASYSTVNSNSEKELVMKFHVKNSVSKKQPAELVNKQRR